MSMSKAMYEIRSELRGGHWVAWVVRTPDGKPDRSILLVGQTREEAEQRARNWADGLVK
jgi:predicted RNase H-like HicB family nuclease